MPALTLVAVVGVLPACDDGAPTGTPSTTTPRTDPQHDDPRAPEPLVDGAVDEPGPGRVALALGSTLRAELDVTTCTVDPAAATGRGAVELVGIAASGVSEDGDPVELSVRRFRSEAAAVTITDTVTVAAGDPDAPALALQAQRFEVGGETTDPRDPAADEPLIRLGEGRVVVRGVFAPPGAFAGDAGLVEGELIAVCG